MVLVWHVDIDDALTACFCYYLIVLNAFDISRTSAYMTTYDVCLNSQYGKKMTHLQTCSI